MEDTNQKMVKTVDENPVNRISIKMARGKPSRQTLAEFIEDNIEHSPFRYASDTERQTYGDLAWVVRDIKLRLKEAN